MTGRSARSRGIRELQRCYAIASFEVLRQRALVAKSRCERALGKRVSALEVTAGGIQADLDQIGMRREPHGVLEQPDEMKPREPGNAREVVKAEIFRIARLHQFDDSAGDGSASRCPLRPAAAAAVSPEQHAEGTDRELVRTQIITFCFEGTMQAAEPADQAYVFQ